MTEGFRSSSDTRAITVSDWRDGEEFAQRGRKGQALHSRLVGAPEVQQNRGAALGFGHVPPYPLSGYTSVAVAAATNAHVALFPLIHELAQLAQVRKVRRGVHCGLPDQRERRFPYSPRRASSPVPIDLDSDLHRQGATVPRLAF